MDSKHTPGPWHISGSGNCLHIGATGSIMVLASMNDVHVDTQANARLIASAPDLFEIALRVIELDGPGGTDSPLAEAARSVIAKVTAA